MASINGITVKNLKWFRGSEGDAAQGNLYIGNKKVGFWSQDADGAFMDTFESNMIDTERLTLKMAEGHPKVKIGDIELDYTPEMFMQELIDLIEDEKEYKKAVKKGYGGVYMIGRYVSAIPKGWSEEQAEDCLKDTIRSEKEYFQYSGQPVKQKYYNSAEQFVIGKSWSVGDFQ